MLSLLRICLYDQTGSSGVEEPEADGGVSEPFDRPFKHLQDVQVISTCASWQQLQECLEATSVDAVIVNLDSVPGRAALAVQRIAEVAANCGIIGVSRSADSDAIIAAMRAGCSQFVRWPVEEADLRAALDRVRQTVHPAGQGCQRVCVLGASGGTGATTIACNLAMELAQLTKRRCALVDMDLQFGDVGCSFDITPRYTVADVCRNGAEIDRTLLETALEALACDVSILVRPEDMAMADEVSPEGVEQMFRVLGQMFPFVVADVPRHFPPAAVAALGGADHVLIVSQLTVPHIRNAMRIYQHLARLGANEDHVHLVLSRSSASFDRIKPDEVRKHFGKPIFATIPNDYKRIGASRDLGHPIMSEAPNSPARLAIQALARRLAADHLGESQASSGGGLMSLFRKKRAKVGEAH